MRNPFFKMREITRHKSMDVMAGDVRDAQDFTNHSGTTSRKVSAMEEEDPYRPDMFADSNRLRFEMLVGDMDKAWWRERFEAPIGLTPEGVGDLLSKSWEGDKKMAVTELDGYKQRFSIKVDGSWGAEEYWFHARSLDLRGALANAERMFISEQRRGQGLGRRFMGDLISTAKMLGLSRITLDAEHIGRYAWLRVGFLPDRGSWRLLSADLLYRLAAAIPDIGTERFIELQKNLNSPHPSAARRLAALSDPVASRELLNPDGTERKIPLGRALFLEIGSNWSGELDLSDDVSMSLAEEYIGGSNGL